MADLAESLARRFEVLRPHLSELQRRLWLGAEAAELGAGVGPRPRVWMPLRWSDPAGPVAAGSGPRSTTVIW